MAGGTGTGWEVPGSGRGGGAGTGSGWEVPGGSAPSKMPQKSGGGGFWHALAKYSGAEYAGNFAKDVGTTAVGIGPGLYRFGGAVAHDVKHTVEYPFLSKEQQQQPMALEKIAKEVGHQYKDYYGHDLLHHLYTHPLQPLLDAATFVTGGASAAVKAGEVAAKVAPEARLAGLAKLGERGKITTRSPRNIATGKGPVHTDITSTKPLVKGRAILGPKITGEEGIGVGPLKVGGEVKRYGKQIQSQATQAAMGRMAPFDVYSKATRGLSHNEWAALHIRAMDIHPSDLAQLWKGTPLEKLIGDAKVQKLALHPSPKMLKAEPQARMIAQQGAALYQERGLLKDETAAARPELTKQQAAETLGRPVREITGKPYYFPHTMEPARNVNPLRSAGGGKAVPRAPGSTKQNLGVLALRGKLHLRSDVLGPEFLRRVKYVKYDEIHNALVRGSLRLSHQDLVERHGGQLPQGYEYVREKASTRIPPTIRGEGDTHTPIGKMTESAQSQERVKSAASQLALPSTTPATFEQTLAHAPSPALQARMENLDGKYESMLDQLAAGEGRPGDYKATTAFKNEYAKKAAAKGIVQPTVKQELRAVAEKRLLDIMRTRPDEPIVKQIQATIDEASAIRKELNARQDEAIGLHEGNTPLAKLIPDPGDLHDSQLAKEGFSTTDPVRAHQSGGHYYIIPKATARAATGEFTRSGDLTRALIKRPLSVWRSAVLGLRVGFLTNNLVGNSIMYAAHTGGKGALRDLFGAIMESHGRDTALKILKDPATPPSLRTDLYKEFFPEQIQGTFGRTQSPSTSPAHLAGQTAAEAYRKVTGAIPRLTSKVAEETPRRALIRNEIRHSPEFKAAYQALPKQARSFEEAARNVLEGKGGKQYQRFISKQVNQSLGDYLNLSPFERNVMRNALPFYSWYRAIVQTTYHLAADTPGRAEALAMIGRVGAAGDTANVPSFLKGAIPLGDGPQGTKRVLPTQGLNPYATLEQIGRGLGQDYTSLGLNPFVEGPMQYLQRSRGNISPMQLALAPLRDLIQNLPPSRLIAPPGPSKLYPTRKGRGAQVGGYLGVPVKEYDPGVAATQARQGR